MRCGADGPRLCGQLRCRPAARAHLVGESDLHRGVGERGGVVGLDLSPQTLLQPIFLSLVHGQSCHGRACRRHRQKRDTEYGAVEHRVAGNQRFPEPVKIINLR
jgi:hypothetical protein